MEKRPTYPSDLTGDEWRIIARLVPRVKRGGRRAEHGRREIVNAIFYVLRTGCQWPMLPHDLLPWKTVYTYFRHWRQDGSWSGSMKPCAKRYAVRRVVMPPPAPPSKTTGKGGRGATTRPGKSRAEKGLF